MSNRTCAVMQPTYLPWSGFFNLIYQTDEFVFLDDAQYSKNSWHNRNQILISGDKSWITVPVGKSLVPINKKQPNYASNWNNKHIKTINENYSRHKYFKDLEPITCLLNTLSSEALSDINISLIKLISNYLGMDKDFRLASELNIKEKRTVRLLEFCHKLSCDHYLSPVGAKGYLEDDGDFNDSNIKLNYQNFIPKPYMQKGSSGFVSHLSIIDVVANVGWDEAKNYIKGDI